MYTPSHTTIGAWLVHRGFSSGRVFCLRGDSLMLFYLRALCIKPVCRVSLVCAVAGVQLTGTTISMRKRLQVNLLMDKQPISLLPWTDFFPNVRRTFVPILWSDVVSWWSVLQSLQSLSLRTSLLRTAR